MNFEATIFPKLGRRSDVSVSNGLCIVRVLD